MCSTKLHCKYEFIKGLRLKLYSNKILYINVLGVIISVMEPLIESYPQFVSCGDLKDITPLHWAAYHGHYKIAHLILEKVWYGYVMCLCLCVCLCVCTHI